MTDALIRREGVWFAVPLLALLAVALLHLPYPFDGDQAFSVLGALAVADGDTLYVDFWDIRQPGVIWFSALAGELFGFTEIGLHLFELCWMVPTAVLIGAVARRWVSLRELAFVAPLLTIGFYYFQATPWELTQPEFLVWLPLIACLYVASDRDDSSTRRAMFLWFLFGVAAGVTAIFKLLLLVIPLALAATRVGHAYAVERARPNRQAAGSFISALLGFLVVIGLVTLHFWRRGALDELYWATFQAPVLALAEVPRAPYRRLLSSASWFAAPWVPALPFMLLGLRSPTRSRREWLGPALLVSWLAVALVAITVQRIQWWPYHFGLLIVPTGLLTLRGIDSAVRLYAGEGRQRRLAALLLLPILLAGAVPCGPKILAAVEALGADAPYGPAFRALIAPTNAEALEIARAVSGPDRLAGPAVVFGDPRILLFSGRKQAIPTRGWALSALPQARWDGYAEALAEARPPYIYVSEGTWPTLEAKAPDVVTWLKAAYRPLDTASKAGTWYERRTP